ncbi:MAG: helix-turn-helix transcriptional regulator [Betaproteobacteria bacterium]
MTNKHQPDPAGTKLAEQLRVIRHNQVCAKLQISSAKLFDMVAKGQFLKPFTLVPGGRAVGFLERDVDQWILERKAASEQEAS